jgi:cathepsin F
MNKFVLLFLFAIVACEVDFDSLAFRAFQRFIKKYNKKYDSMNEYLARFQAFRQNLNKLAENGPQTYKTGITKFADMTQQEFAKTYLNLNFNAFALLNLNPVKVKVTNAAPDAFDWRDKNVVSAVKDQGSCGSCWAFSTIANLEGLYALEKGVVKTFSEQLLVDCDTLDSGCNGGLMELSFEWLKDNGGFMYESDYPYTGKQQTCKQDSSKFVDMKVTGYVKLGDGGAEEFSPVDEGEMKEFLYQTGPLAIALNATPLQLYFGGIVDLASWLCPTSGINHAVTVVGYGSESKDYWIVKNSWGKSWGESGYFRIARGKETCGVNYYVTTATVSF